jgi:glyceraldehyde 3-phosphate dehydrogenase
MTLNVKNHTSIEQVNKAFKEASETYLKGLLSYTTEPLVSIDINWGAIFLHL